ncbi:uncharacterized protein LOC141879796 isoform X2 [Acropora palmata]|uniref:uncharacterized protein LOC141879796 isoform X2 n=1 Tax=Acropora palmata TaxID=6131 RepID=UPI003DA08587
MRGNFAKAIEYYKEAIRLLEELKISGCPDEATFQRHLANAYFYQNNFKDAVEPAEKAFEIRKKYLGDHPDTVRSIFQRGVIQASLEEPEKALDLFKKAWEMEKSLQPGNHSVVWKPIIEHIVLFIKDDILKKKFKKEALAFCQRFWKEEKEISTFSFNESTKEIIDALMEFLRDGERDESIIYDYEKEELWFYDGFQSSTEQDFWRNFDAETDNSKLNEMICNRTKLIDKILDLCDRLDQHEMRTKYQRMKLTIYRKVLFRPNFVGEEGNKKATIKKAMDQLYRDLDEKERIAETFLNSGEKPGTLRYQETEVEKEEEEKEGQIVSEEEEIEMRFEDERVEQLEDEEEVVLTSDGKSETASEDENEFVGDFSNTNCESIVLYRGEAVAYCFLKQVGVHLISPPGAVAEGSVSTVRRRNPRFRSSLLSDNEAVVSDVIELSLDSPGALHFDKAVTLVIPHCASALKGYEVVVKCLSSGDEWKDVETSDWRTKTDIKEDWDLFGHAPDFSFPVAACKITQCSTFAVVCRLKSHRHVVTSQESELVWPEIPLAKVIFPQNAVPQGESFEVIAQLQEVCQRPYRQKQILPGPILRITSSKEGDFLKPIAVQLPLSLSEPHRKDIDMSVARVRILFKESSSEKKEWIEVTEKLETLPRFDGNVITFAVSHFSWYRTLVDWCHSILPFYRVVESASVSSKSAFFAVYVPRSTCLHGDTKLRVYCIPTSKRCEMIDCEEKQGNILIGDGSSIITMCSNEEGYVFLSEGIVTPLKTGGLLVRLQEEPFLRNLPVRVDNQGVFTVSFCGSKERDEDNMLCELDVTLPPSINVPDKKGGEGLRHTRDHLTEGTSLDPEITAQGVEARKRKRKKNFTGHSSGVPPKRKTGTKKNETAQPAGLGALSQDDVLGIAHELSSSWKMFGRVLNVPDAVIDQIEADESKVSEKCYCVIRRWQERYSADATYHRLARALQDPSVDRVDVAVKYCGLQLASDEEEYDVDEGEESNEEEDQQQEHGKPTKKKEKKTGKVSKLLEDLVKDASDSLVEICQRLDTRTAGVGTEVEKEEEEEKEGQIVPEEEEIEMRFEDERVEQLEDEEEVVLTSDGKSETTSEDGNEFVGDFSNSNCESFVLYRGEAVAYCFLKQVGVHLISPPGAVAEGSVSTVRRWNRRFRSPLLSDNEAVVSDVIELSLDSPVALHFDKTVTLVIPHCASALKGYEVVVKCLSSSDEWKDVETADWRTRSDIKEDWDLFGYAPDFSFPVAACKITQCSTFAVVCRLKSHRHVVTSQESELVWPEIPLAKVTFPQNAVPQGESFEVIAQLQEVCQRPYRQKQILPGPILRITSSKEGDFLKPIAVQLPLSLSEPHRKDIDMSVARVRILFKESSSEKKEWIEITEKLETLPRFDGNVITFAVSHFSWYRTLVDWCHSIFPFYRVVESASVSSKSAFFAVYVPRSTCLHGDTKLRVYCIPTSKRCEMIDCEEKQGNILIGDGSSIITMCSNEEAYVFLSEGIVTPLKTGGLLVRLQEEPFLKNLPVRVENQGVLTVSFCRSKERDEDNMLCELDVTLPPSINDPDKKGGEGLRHTRDHLTEGITFGQAFSVLVVITFMEGLFSLTEPPHQHRMKKNMMLTMEKKAVKKKMKKKKKKKKNINSRSMQSQQRKKEKRQGKCPSF